MRPGADPPGGQIMTEARMPALGLSDPTELLLAYLDRYRDVVERKLTGLSEADLRSSRLPSGWSPLELLQHLVFMERRWLVWAFLGEDVPSPWGDGGPHGSPGRRWHVAPETTLDHLVAALHDGGRRTREIATGAGLSDVARPGGRFRDPAQAPTLGWILCHVLEEYARHAGHLDIVRELIDGATGE
jgi:hypothetical protein